MKITTAAAWIPFREWRFGFTLAREDRLVAFVVYVVFWGARIAYEPPPLPTRTPPKQARQERRRRARLFARHLTGVNTE